MKRRLVLAGVLLLSVSGCGEDQCKSEPRSLLAPETSLRIGQTTTVEVFRFAGVGGAFGPGLKYCPSREIVTWRSDDPAVLLIEVPTGERTTVRAVGIGSAMVSASEATAAGAKEHIPLRFTVSP
jgi:hypothetical protein